MKVINQDCLEIASILKAKYGGAETKANRSSEYVLDKIAESIDDAYLVTRVAQFTEYTQTHGELQDYLTRLYEDCCEENRCERCAISKYCNHYINTRVKNYDHDAPTIVDLFCGAGGLSLGFVQEGFKISLANDIEACCIDTYSHNHPETPRKHIVQGDINQVIENIQELLRFKDVDCVVGGPPCQGFSMANRQRLIDDPRNSLYKSYVKVVSIVRPKFFIMENVKGMQSVAHQVIEDFERIGYNVDCMVFNAKDFGVPQNRERLIYVGNKIGLSSKDILKEICESAKEYKEHVLADALYGLRALHAMRVNNATEMDTEESGGKIERDRLQLTNSYINLINGGRICEMVYNHKARYNNDRDIEIYSRLEQGDRSDDPKIADIMPYGRRNDIFKDKYFKLEEDKVCKTITAHMKFDCNMYIHPTQARGLTPREAARVQSYPDDYFFRGAYTKTYMQIGNSVPPMLGRAIAKIIKKYLKENNL